MIPSVVGTTTGIQYHATKEIAQGGIAQMIHEWLENQNDCVNAF